MIDDTRRLFVGLFQMCSLILIAVAITKHTGTWIDGTAVSLMVYLLMPYNPEFVRK